jgi:hypothetical protein
MSGEKINSCEALQSHAYGFRERCDGGEENNNTKYYNDEEYRELNPFISVLFSDIDFKINKYQFPIIDIQKFYKDMNPEGKHEKSKYLLYIETVKNGKVHIGGIFTLREYFTYSELLILANQLKAEYDKHVKISTRYYRENKERILELSKKRYQMQKEEWKEMKKKLGHPEWTDKELRIHLDKERSEREFRINTELILEQNS